MAKGRPLNMQNIDDLCKWDAFLIYSINKIGLIEMHIILRGIIYDGKPLPLTLFVISLLRANVEFAIWAMYEWKKIYYMMECDGK